MTLNITIFRVKIDVRENPLSSKMVTVSKPDEGNLDIDLLLTPGLSLSFRKRNNHNGYIVHLLLIFRPVYLGNHKYDTFA